MPLYNVNAIVLHRSNLGETDRILTLFTREHGKVRAVAKGSRKSGSRLTGASELFVHSKFMLASGKSLEIVSQVDIQETFPQLRRDMLSIARAAYLCELTDKFIEDHQVDPETFDLLLCALYWLQRPDVSSEAAQHAFEMQLLMLHGYAPQIEACVRCSKLVPDGISYSPSLGGILCEKDKFTTQDSFPIGSETVKLLRYLGNSQPDDLARISDGTHCFLETARSLRWTVRYRIDRDLKSAEFLELILRPDANTQVYSAH